MDDSRLMLWMLLLLLLGYALVMYMTLDCHIPLVIGIISWTFELSDRLREVAKAIIRVLSCEEKPPTKAESGLTVYGRHLKAGGMDKIPQKEQPRRRTEQQRKEDHTHRCTHAFVYVPSGWHVPISTNYGSPGRLCVYHT